MFGLSILRVAKLQCCQVANVSGVSGVPTYKPSNPKVSVNYCTLSWHDFSSGCCSPGPPLNAQNNSPAPRRLKYYYYPYRCERPGQMLSKCLTLPHCINFASRFLFTCLCKNNIRLFPWLKIKVIMEGALRMAVCFERSWLVDFGGIVIWRKRL